MRNIPKNGRNAELYATSAKKMRQVNRMTYNKDYFTGMEHIVAAINYEIGRMSTKNEQFMEKYVDNDYFRGIERGLKDARKLVNDILYIHLKNEGR